MYMRDVPQRAAAPRVLIVSNLFPPHVLGGAEVVAHRQAHQLRARGYVVSVFAGGPLSGHDGPLLAEEDDGLRVWRVPIVSLGPDDSFFIPTVEARLRAVLEVERPDLVHFHNVSGLGYSLIPAVKRYGLPAVVTLHDHAGYCFRGTALRSDNTLCAEPEECGEACQQSITPRRLGIAMPMRLRRDYVLGTLSRADRLISPSGALAASFGVAGAADVADIRVISNGIDLAQFQRLARKQSQGVLRFACIAYLGEHKGIPDLLEAAARLTAHSDLTGRWQLTIAGDGHLRRPVEEAITHPRFGGAVKYLGKVSRAQIIAELSATDVIVLPSRWPENEPVVLLEAIAAGVAQLATNIGGTAELVHPGITGELVPANDPEALAHAMAGYVREPERAHRQGQANEARRNNFSEERTIDAIAALYTEVLRAPSAPRPDHPLVLCAGESPSPQIAEICNHLHRIEGPGQKARLVWHEWADPGAWEQAALFWNWSSTPHQPALRRALRAGVPILAPRSCAAMAAIEKNIGAVVIYDTFLEALLTLARLPHDSVALSALQPNCPEAATLLANLAAAENYHLIAPTASA
jgi:glycosyltransferase involved in cell wall biosynthesis